jgi:hypothetical protein
MLEWIIGNFVISKVDTLTCVIVSKAEKPVPFGGLIGTTECVTPSEVSH